MSPRPARALAVALAVLLPLASTSCSDGESSPARDNRLATVLIDSVPTGFEPAPRATGPIGPQQAAVAIAYVDPAVTQDLLTDLGFAAAFARVWTRHDEFVSAYAFRLEKPFGAQELVDHALRALQAEPSAVLFTVEGISGAQGYVLNGVARQNRRDLFCQGVWFARGDTAYNQNVCSSARPSDAEAVLVLARRQAAAAARQG